MSTVIEGGTVVTADLTHKADVLIDDETISQIGANLRGDTVIDATGCYVMPGGIDPHTYLEMPLQAVNQALSSWKALTTPQPVERKAENTPIGV